MVLTVDQVAEKLQVSPANVREMIRDGILPGFKRSKRLWGVLLADLEKWFSSRGRKVLGAEEAK